MSEQLQGSPGDPEKMFQIRQSLEAERASLTELYAGFLSGQMGRDERIRLRVDLEQRIKALRGEVWDKQEVPMPDVADKGAFPISDLFGIMTQLEDRVVELRARGEQI